MKRKPTGWLIRTRDGVFRGEVGHAGAFRSKGAALDSIKNHGFAEATAVPFYIKDSHLGSAEAGEHKE